MKMRVKVFVDAHPSALVGSAASSGGPSPPRGAFPGGDSPRGGETPAPSPAAAPAPARPPPPEPNVHVGVETALHLLLNETADRGWLHGLHSCVFVTYEGRPHGRGGLAPLVGD